MKYFKIIFDDGIEYYAVEAEDKPFCWYSDRDKCWKSTDCWSALRAWSRWCNRWSKTTLEVSQLEVLVVCGSVKE